MGHSEVYTILRTVSGRYSYRTDTWRCAKSWARRGDVLRVLRSEGWTIANP